MQAKKKGIEVTVSYDGLPADQYVMLDEQRFQQILLNFVSNALKFTSEGSVQIAIFFIPPSQASTSSNVKLNAFNRMTQ